MGVIQVLVDKYCEMPRSVRRPMWQIWHKLLIRFDKNANVNFMNYGYADLNGRVPLQLDERDETNRYCIQLYDRVVRDGEIADKQVLEVGSGRGGGADYIARYYKPVSYTGMDISSSVIDFCNRHYQVDNLQFKRGYAEDLPFEDGSFDRVVNVESARCYHDLSQFFSEVNRVLKPGGYFLFADMIEPHEFDTVQDKLKQSGLELIEKKDITENVVKALDQDSTRREDLVSNLVPGFLQNAFSAFAGTKGTDRYDSFRNGTYKYWYHKLHKTA